MRQIRRCLLYLLLMCFACCGDALGQEAAFGIVFGRVHDQNGVAVGGVRVEARATDRAAPSASATADNTGSYRLGPLAPGTFDISFSLLGFATAVSRVTVETAAEIQLDATLRLRLETQVVVSTQSTFRDLSEVTDESDLLGIANAATSGVVSASRIEQYPVARPADLAERVPGVVVSQHSGEGKANQYYVRGFNIDHGSDLALSVAGLPVNLPTNGHGQGYADLNFLIPELVSGIQFKKGPYHAAEGDFSTAGSIHLNYLNVLQRPILKVESGDDGVGRMLVAISPQVGSGHILAALELARSDGPWVRPDDFRKANAVVRYSRGSARSGFSITGMTYDAVWNSTDQVPARAIENGLISRFGVVDDTDGGRTHRRSIVAAWQQSRPRSVTRVEGFASEYGLNLFSNFTYFLEDPEDGDQFEQEDDRWLMGTRASHTWVVGTTKPTEVTVGTQLRRDDVAPLGLHLTTGRARRLTVREDAVIQRSAGVYAQADTQWMEKVRTTVGLRGDLVAVDVASSDPANSGTASDSLTSPKFALALGPWSNTEIYANYGRGFHSNDGRGATITRDPTTGGAVEPVDLLVGARGAEFGARFVKSGVHATAAVWRLDIDSEQLFIGDAGTTEASRPSARRGVEIAVDYAPRPWLRMDASYAWSRARFTDGDEAGERIPGAVEGVLATGLAISDVTRWSGSVHFRWFGARPLIEDNSVRSSPTALLNGELSYALGNGWSIHGRVFNLLNRQVADIDYYYASRLPGEPDEGVEDIHTHPTPPRSYRVGLVFSF